MDFKELFHPTVHANPTAALVEVGQKYPAEKLEPGPLSGGKAGLGPEGGASAYLGFENDGTQIIGRSVSAGVRAGAGAYDDLTKTYITPIFGRKTVMSMISVVAHTHLRGRKRRIMLQ